jgi:predicted secreted protein
LTDIIAAAKAEDERSLRDNVTNATNRGGSMTLHRRAAALAVLLFSVLLLPAAARAEEAVQAYLGVEARVGEAVVLILKGNPSTGYTWRLNEARSHGLDGVVIKELGWMPIGGSAKIGAPGLLRIEVVPKVAGSATLAFDYLRPWESKPPVRTAEFLIVAAPRKAE